MKALSLFSGIGGIDLAGEWAGIETVAFCEREPFPQKVLRKHWPNIPIYDDVCTLTKERLDADGIGPIELIHGGYPCQPFSNAGKRAGTSDDRHLWPEVFRLIKEIRPRWFVGENVAGHITLGLDTVLADLESFGYTAEAIVLPACSVNAPHRRDRVFIVGHSDSQGCNSGRGNQQGRQIFCGSEWIGQESEQAGDKWISGVSSDSCPLAHSPGERCGETREHQSERTTKWTTGSGQTISNPTSPGLSIGRRSEWPESDTETGAGMESESERCGSDVSGSYGAGCEEQHIAADPSGTRLNTWGTPSGWEQWATEPDVGRVANGVPKRVDRLKALGNAVVPQQIYPILAAIKQIDDLVH